MSDPQKPPPKIIRLDLAATRETSAGWNTLDRWVCPIVLLPGVMGTRLDLASNAVWDPDSKRCMVGWAWRTAEKARELLSVRHTAKVMTSSTSGVPGRYDVETFNVDLGWAGVIKSYKGVLMSLHETLNGPFSEVRDWRYPIHAVGYDWRIDIRDSAYAVAQQIKKIRGLYSDQKVILVTHSMGGLVGRAACLLQGALADVRGVVHVVQPVNGAVIAYRRFIDGLEADKGSWFTDAEKNIFASVIGGTRLGYTLMMSGMVGPVQLLPNHHYDGWLKGADGAAVPAGSIYQVYKGQGADKQLGIVSELGGDRKAFARHAKPAVTPEMAADENIAMASPGHDGWYTAGEIQAARKRLEAAREKALVDLWGRYMDDLGHTIDLHQAIHTDLDDKGKVGWVHPRTFVLYAAGLTTDDAYDWSLKQGERARILPACGDSTVPRASAVGLDAAVEKAWSDVNLPPSLARLSVDTGANNHQYVFDGPGVAADVLARIRLLQYCK